MIAVKLMPYNWQHGERVTFHPWGDAEIALASAIRAHYGRKARWQYVDKHSGYAVVPAGWFGTTRAISTLLHLEIVDVVEPETAT